MNNLNAIRTGIYSKLTGTTNAFKTSISSRLFFSEAPLDSQLPLCVFSFLPINESADSVNEFNDCTVQFRIADKVLTVAETIAEQLKAEMSSTIALTGYKTIELRKTSTINLGNTGGVWNIIVQYRLKIQLN